MSRKSHIQAIFNIKPDEIQIEHIKEFFSSPQEETALLEFKSGKVEIISLYKEITAFLNTEGGLIIVGAPEESIEDKGGKNVRICQGDLTNSNFRGKDWLYQKITSNITPSPTNIKIIELNSDFRTVFLIDIPQSMNPPHQSRADGRYFLRLECEAKPAPHGIVQALFQKRQRPELRAKVNSKRINDHTDSVNVSLLNDSAIPANDACIHVEVYNVNLINCEHKFTYIDDLLGDKYFFTQKLEQPLVQFITPKFEFEVKHKSSKYLVFVGYWSKEVGFSSKYGIYDPSLVKFTVRGSLEDKEKFLDDLNLVFDRDETPSH